MYECATCPLKGALALSPSEPGRAGAIRERSLPFLLNPGLEQTNPRQEIDKLSTLLDVGCAEPPEPENPIGGAVSCG